MSATSKVDLTRAIRRKVPPRSRRAVVLAGGRGTRLAPYTSVLPKPLMPIGDRSILEIVIEQLAYQGFERVSLCVGYLSHLIRAVLDNVDLPIDVEYVVEGNQLGTAGPLRLIDDLDDTFVVMNGDVLSTLRYQDLVGSHRESGNVITVAARQRTIRIDYGVLDLDGDIGSVRRVTGWREKPEIPSYVSMGIYAVEPEALTLIEPDAYLDFPDLVHKLLRAGAPVGAFPFDGLWFDIGRPDDYARASSAWANTRPLPSGPSRLAAASVAVARSQP